MKHFQQQQRPTLHPFLTNQLTIWEPIYQRELQPNTCELELMESKVFRRLKHLHHFGASALISPIVHSRYEHTLGVWSLIEHFFPEQQELRIAALLHDLGHLPFSHAVEKALGFDHHQITAEYILEGEIAQILQKHGFSPNSIVQLLDEDTPLTSQTDYLGADHLDSFLRDTYLAGKYVLEPKAILPKLSFEGHYIQTDEATALALIETIVQDHKIYLAPSFLAVDALLAHAITAHFQQTKEDLQAIKRLTDDELLALLKASENRTTQRLIHTLLDQPHRIQIEDQPRTFSENDAISIEVTVRKVYKKTPLVQGLPFTELSLAAEKKLNEIHDLKRSYYVYVGEY